MSLATLTLSRPWWLLALPSLGLLLWLLWKREDAGKASWQRMVDPHLLPYLLVGTAPQTRRHGLVMLAGGLLLAVLCLAGPSLDQQRDGLSRRDATRVLVLDLSPQMEAAPFGMERLRLKISALLHALPEGQTALLVYAGEPFLVVPPTSDVETIARFVPELAAEVVPVAGNRPERALGLAGEILGRSGSARRDVVWITAGQGAGIPDSSERLSILHVAAAADPGLAASATRSGGRYVPMTADDSDVRRLVATLAAADSWVGSVRSANRNGVDVGYWLLLPLLPLAALAFRRGLLALLLLVSQLAAPPAEAVEFLSRSPSAVDSQAARASATGAAGQPADFNDPRWRAVAAYRAGRFDQAADLLDGLRDPDSLYNRGNALAKQWKLAEALAAYDSALQKRPDDADMRHNRDLVRRLLNEQENSGEGPTGAKAPAPKPASAQPSTGAAGNADEAARLAQQWLRNVPDEPGDLLRRKLLIEHRRRLAGSPGPAW